MLKLFAQVIVQEGRETTR